MKFQIKLSPFAIISITIIIGIMMVVSAFIELNQSKKEIYNLLYEHSSTLLQSIIKSSENTLNSSFEIESLITNKLLDNARMIRKLDSLNALNKNELIKISNENNIFRVNIFNKTGQRILSNRIPEPDHLHGEENINRYDELSSILNGEESEFIIGLKKAEFTDEERYAVAVARANNKGAIVVNLDAKELLEFRKKIGIGVILQEIANQHGIEYIILQDTLGILAASETIDSTESITSSDFLKKALNSDLVFSRVTTYNGAKIYEVIKRFVMDNESIGIYRLGVSLEDIKKVESRMIRRLIFLSIVLAAISVIVLSIVFTDQNLKTLSKEYNRFKTFASSVLENMTEAVIVINTNGKITFINSTAEKLFYTKSQAVLNKNLSEINQSLSQIILEKIRSTGDEIFEKEITIKDKNLILSFSITQTKNPDNGELNYIIVIDDITERKILEEESKKNEKLSAMGELASGVAHEIRNPINAIGMIAQRLNKEFTTTENQEEYQKITLLLRNEVNRINKIITQFLNYAKPLDLNILPTNPKDFFEDIYQIFFSQANLRKINFIISGDCQQLIKIDPDLMKQALMNIIQNAFDAVKENGEVKLNYYQSDKNFIIEISDNGTGISTENQKKIFDLYYTTKKEGNGLGLSISQKIVTQHKGKITLTSKPNFGTTFKIILPL